MKNSKFQFSNPTLQELNFKVNKNFNKDGFKGMPIQYESTVKNGEKSAQIELKIIVGNEDPITPFSICVIMNSEFWWDDTFDDNKVEDLLKCNAPALLLSYIRPYIVNITNGSGFPPLNLPFMDFTDGSPEGCITEMDSPDC